MFPTVILHDEARPTRASSPSSPPPSTRPRLRGRRTRFAALAVAAGLAALPAAAADAATVSVTNGVVTYIGNEGDDGVGVDNYSEGFITVYADHAQTTAGEGCTETTEDSGAFQCAVSGPPKVRIETRGGVDRVSPSFYPSLPKADFVVDLGAGDDSFNGNSENSTVFGGPGNDDLLGLAGDDDLDGGPGNDKIHGGAGTDVLHGGDGDDQIDADGMGTRYPDIIDGGAGRDIVDDWMPDEDPAMAPPVSISLNGAADDGFAGEGDNVTGFEIVKIATGVVFNGDDAPNVVVATEVGSPSTMNGFGGDDQLSGTDRADVIDGGAGADELNGGYGGDTITGGPGADVINGDRPARCNEMHCDISPGAANDVINARDGEVDSIACGPGEDRVVADASDVVAADCENVDRGGASGGGKDSGGSGSGAGSGSGGGTGPGAGGTVKFTVLSAPKLAAALKSGFKVRVPAAAGSKVSVKALKAGKVVASGTAKATSAGAAVVKLKFTAAARKSLKRARSVKLMLKAGAKSLAVTLRR